MKKIGIRFEKHLDFDIFDSFQYLLDFDVDYDELMEEIDEKKIIELDIDCDESEDRADDLEVLEALLAELREKENGYELFIFDEEWVSKPFMEVE